MKLIYNTKGNCSPLGKQNIYVSCCGEDYQELTAVMEDIRRSQRGSDCALWYDYEPEAPFDKESLNVCLEGVQLVVFVVTNRMLTGHSRSIDYELAYLREHGVPILPVLMAGADSGEYDHRFAGITELCRESSDYTEQLERLLTKHLGSYELIQKIEEQCFGGRIHIITDEKDRHKLFAIKRKLHELEFCRDFVITSDDPFGAYRTPDEEQNAFLQSSDITILVVSPNFAQNTTALINRTFPYIRDNGIPYIPVEIAETRRGKLQSGYKGIAEPIDFSDEQAVREALGDAVGMKAEGKDDAMHRYLVGVAYQKGIVVEVDRERGRGLIASAGSEDVAEARAALAEMYYTGVGTQRSLDNAVVWQRKVIDDETGVYNGNTTLENAARLAAAINLLGEMYIEIQKPDKAENAFINVSSLCERRLRNEAYAGVISEYARCSKQLGMLREQKFNMKSAEEYYKKALDYCNKLMLGEPSIEVMHRIATVSEHYGDMCMAKGLLTEADEVYRRAYERRDYLAKEIGGHRNKIELCHTLEKLSQLYIKADDLERAEECCVIAGEILGGLAKQTGTIQTRRELAHSMNQLGYVYAIEDRTHNAINSLIGAAEIREALYKEIKAEDIARELIATYEQLGNLCGQQGNAATSREFYMRGINTRRALAAQFPENHGLLEEIAEAACRAVDNGARQSGDKELLEDAAAIYERLYKFTGQKSYRERAQEAKRRVKPGGIVTERVRIKTKR